MAFSLGAAGVRYFTTILHCSSCVAHKKKKNKNVPNLNTPTATHWLFTNFSSYVSHRPIDDSQQVSREKTETAETANNKNHTSDDRVWRFFQRVTLLFSDCAKY